MLPVLYQSQQAVLPAVDQKTAEQPEDTKEDPDQEKQPNQQAQFDNISDVYFKQEHELIPQQSVPNLHQSSPPRVPQAPQEIYQKRFTRPATVASKDQKHMMQWPKIPGEGSKQILSNILNDLPYKSLEKLQKMETTAKGKSQKHKSRQKKAVIKSELNEVPVGVLKLSEFSSGVNQSFQRLNPRLVQRQTVTAPGQAPGMHPLASHSQSPPAAPSLPKTKRKSQKLASRIRKLQNLRKLMKRSPGKIVTQQQNIEDSPKIISIKRKKETESSYKIITHNKSMLDIDEHLEGHERLGSVVSGSNQLELNKTHQQSFKITHSDASSIHTARGFISRSNEIRNIIAQKLRQKARPRSTHSKLHRGPDYRRNWLKEKQHLILKKLESKIRQNYDAGRKKKKRSKSSK